jgi:transposase InsO family protein
MWQINEVLRFDEQLYRILAVKPGEIVWIRIDTNTAQPERITELELISYLDEERLFRHADPFSSIDLEEPLVGSVAFNRRERGLLIIQPIIVDELCFDPKIRARRVEQVRLSGIASIATIYKLLRRYWQRGQKPNSLLPDYKNSGAPGKTRAASGQAKIGRTRQFGDGEGMKVTPDIERLFRLTIEKYILSQDGLKTTVAYRRFSDLFEQYYPQVVIANRPTIRQFRYFYDREYKKPQRLVARTSLGVYKKDVRPLTSTATANVLGPGSRYEIDATIADIYLVADDDRSKIIGRPTVYIVIDVFSRMIAGFYIGFNNPSYVVAMQAVVNACIDKTDICSQLGVEINPGEWPCIGLPDVILADRGEMMSHQVDGLITGFNLRIESAPPRRGDAKGIVESCFRTLQAEFKPFAPGVVAGNRVKKHGERDYRLDAVMPINDFSQIILRTILFRNNYHVLDKYDRDADLPADIPSIPLELWNWGMQHRVGGLRQVDPQQLQIALLPRRKVTVSPFGVNMWGLYYFGSDILREGWLHRSIEINRPESLEAAYDPGCADTIYLFPQSGSRIFWVCSLTDRSRQYRGMTFWQVWEIQAKEKHNKANAKLKEDEKRRELDAFIKRKINDATKQSSSSSESDQQRIQQIKSNKKNARDVERQSRVKPVIVDSSKPLADVVSLNQVEDYSLPNFVPGLFDDGEGDAE